VTGENTLFLSFAIQLLSVFALFIGDKKASSVAAHLLLLMGLLTGFVVSVMMLSGVISFSAAGTLFNNEYLTYRLDSAALFFLCVVQGAAIAITIYSYSYLGYYISAGKNVKNLMLFYILLVVFTQALVTADHAVMFLICWEIMSMSAYLGMLFKKEQKEVQDGSFYYLAMSHFIMYLLFFLFFILHNISGTWLISGFNVPSGSSWYPIIFITALLAFGMKAGFMPVHFWLPRAHPIAPTTISAFLSGVIIKTGIYGIFRTFQILQPVPEWMGWVLMAVAVISAVFGVWYALAQHDIKTLLAYHSVENIGIIGIGLAIGFLGSAKNAPALVLLGFGGALLHTLNHALFKSLLFLGSGVLDRNLGTKNIELMGGLVHKAPFFAALFLAGSVAISGIPPFNGFVSEFIIFISFFKASAEFGGYYPIYMLICSVALAFVGGLAIACFTKINSIIFLGEERKPVEKFSVSLPEYGSLGILALACLIIGVFPSAFIKTVYKTAYSFNVNFAPSFGLPGIEAGYISLAAFIIFAAVILFSALKVFLERRYGRRKSGAWACGYKGLSPRMQYTASSFADGVNSISSVPLQYFKKVKYSGKKAVYFESHSSDLVDKKIILSFFASVEKFFSEIKIFDSRDIRVYVLMIVIMASIYGAGALFWK
jgi:hydrogenase-4 component B